LDRKRNIIQSFNYAISGLIHVLRTQRSMQIHFAIAIAVLIASLFLNFTRVEFIGLLLIIAIVITAELFNTAVEAIVDIYISSRHPMAQVAKDVSAAAVLITSMTAVLIGYLLFFDRMSPFALSIISRVAQSAPAITAVCLLLVSILIILLKAFSRTGSPISGGFPSGHSALAFSGFTAITLITQNYLISSISLFMALLVIQSRLEKRIHEFVEVIAGSIIGILVTVLIFQLAKIYM